MKFHDTSELSDTSQSDDPSESYDTFEFDAYSYGDAERWWAGVEYHFQEN